MNINENIRNERNKKINRGVSTKLPISHKLKNLVPYQSLDKCLLLCYLINKLPYLNILTY